MTYLAFKARLPEMRLRLSRGEPVQRALEGFSVRPLGLREAMRLQLRIIGQALEALPGALPGDY